jgi:hypothetical protein
MRGIQHKSEYDRLMAIKLAQKAYYQRNKEKVKKRAKIWLKNNPTTLKEYYKKNKDVILKRSKTYYKNHKKEKNIYDSKYYKINKNKILKRNKKYYKKNIESIKKSKNEWKRNRRLNNSMYHLIDNIRSLIGISFRKNGYKKNGKTEQILGCSFEEFKTHIEAQFESWMNWNNRGNWNGYPKVINHSWDIDHITPISTAKSIEDVIKLNHYTNFKPLCSYTNRNIKKNKI